MKGLIHQVGGHINQQHRILRNHDNLERKRWNMNPKTKRSLMKEGIGWFLNLPFVIYSIIFFIIPIIWAFWLSTMDWNLISKNRTFVGFNNFSKLVHDPHVQAAFFNSFRYLAAIVLLSVIGGILVGSLVYQLPNKIKGVCSVLFFVPYLTSGVAIAVVVRYLLSNNSVFNTWLKSIGIHINWFKDPFWAFWVMVFLVVWKMAGYYSLFFVSALESIPEEVNEACMLDGSRGLHRFFFVTLRMILPTMSTVIILASGLAFSIFTEPYLLTGGGPGKATTTWQIVIYNTSFVKFQSGYGAAIALASALQIFIVIKLVSIAMNRLNRRYGAS